MKSAKRPMPVDIQQPRGLQAGHVYPFTLDNLSLALARHDLLPCQIVNQPRENAMNKVKRVWVPGFEKRLAAGSNGILYRFRKTTRTLEPIPMKTKNHMVFMRHGSTDVAYPYAYLVALAFLDIAKAPQTSGPHARPRVDFKDGDRMNTRPDNLRWMQTGEQLKLDKLTAKEAIRHKLNNPEYAGEFRQIHEAPDYYAKDDGMVWKLQKNGDLKLKKPVWNRGQLFIKLNPYFPNYLMLKEVIADLFIPPRTHPKCRARTKDGNPANTRPDNLEWHMIYQAPYYKHTVNTARSEQRDAHRSKEVHDRQNRTMDALIAMGARRLSTDPRLWVTPDGLIYWIDHNSGARSLLRSAGGKLHIPGGFMDAHGKTVFSRSTRGITAGNVVFDAFPELTAEARRTPDDPTPPMRSTCQTTYPKDGNPDNTHPDNLLLMSTPSVRRLFVYARDMSHAKRDE